MPKAEILSTNQRTRTPKTNERFIYENTKSCC